METRSWWCRAASCWHLFLRPVTNFDASSGSGRDGESPPRPPGRTRRAVFPHRAPQGTEPHDCRKVIPTFVSVVAAEAGTRGLRAGSPSLFAAAPVGCDAVTLASRAIEPVDGRR